MPTYTYEPGLALDQLNLTPVSGAIGQFTTTAGAPLATYDLTGAPAPIVTNDRGYYSGFKADEPTAILSFGDVGLPVVSIEARDSGLAAAAAEAAATAAAASAQSAATSAETAAAAAVAPSDTAVDAGIDRALAADKVLAAAERAGFARVAAAAGAPHVQLGPTTRTLHSGPAGTYTGVLAFQNNAPDAPDDATRIYIVPRAKPTTGVAGVQKIFGDPYFDGADYRDFGTYHSADQAGDTGHHGTGVFWLNSKTGGASYAGKNPDIGFSFQDGLFVGGRFSLVDVAGALHVPLVLGSGGPDISTKSTTVRADIAGDLGFSGADRSIRWYAADGITASNVLRFASDRLKLFLGSVEFVNISQDKMVWVSGASEDGFVRSSAGRVDLRVGGATRAFVDTNAGINVPNGGYLRSATVGGVYRNVVGIGSDDRVKFVGGPSGSDWINAASSAVLAHLADNGSLGLGTRDQFGGGAKVIGIQNATTVPTTNPTGGGVLYAEGGALKWRSSAGTVTTIGPA